MSSTTTTNLVLSSSLFITLLLCHVSCWDKPCRLIGRRHECLTAPFVPAFSLAGAGYDVATMQRKEAHVVDMRTFLHSDESCTLYCNPLQGGILQKVPLSVGDWNSFKQCPFNLHGSRHKSVRSVLDAYVQYDSDDWVLGLDLPRDRPGDYGGTRTKFLEFASSKAKEDQFTYTIHQLSCSQYRIRVADKPILTSDFLHDVDSLSKVLNASTHTQYRALIAKYGTHFIRQVYLGGRYRRVSAIRTCLSALNGMSNSQVEACLRMGLTDSFGMLTFNQGKGVCSKVLTNQHLTTPYAGGMHQEFVEVTGGHGWDGKMVLTRNDSDGYHKWLDTLQSYPEAIKYSLKPLHALVWDAPRRAGIKRAIQLYLDETALKRQPAVPLTDCPKRAWRGHLIVTIVRAYRLNGDVWSETDAYVKLWYGNIQRTTPVINSDNPRWDARYDLGKVDTHPGVNLKVEVWDDDYAADDLLGACVKHVRQGTHKHTCATTSGGFEFIVTLTCDPYLTGSRCEQYKPSPT